MYNSFSYNSIAFFLMVSILAVAVANFLCTGYVAKWTLKVFRCFLSNSFEF